MRSKTKIVSVLMAAVLLSGCVVAAPEPAPPPVPVPSAAPVAAQGIAGLEEREPDLCGAKDYVQYLGQPGALIPTMGLTKQYRVVEYRGIEPQNYDPNRIVFRLDAANNIYNIDCG